MEERKEAAVDAMQMRRLKEAVRYVSRTWLPVNSKNLHQIRTRLDAGYYTEQRQDLFDDIKSDFSLLAFCLRKLETVLSAEQTSINPIDSLRGLEVDQLRAILSTTDGEISCHRLEDMKEVQALRVRHSLISCGTAEMLARKTSLDPDFAFSCALLRQLGFILVAWNYPTSFQKAVAAVGVSGNDIESELAKVVGFTPAHLGYEVTLNWNSSQDMRAALDWRGQSSTLATPRNFKESLEISAGRQTATTIASYCVLGEKLARVNNKDHYPKAVQEWKDAERELAHLMGPNGVKDITDRVNEMCRNYVSYGPELFSRDSSPESSVKKANTEFITQLIESNTFIPRCPAQMQKEFKEVYSQMMQGEVSTQAVSYLITKLIPAAGFVRGCIFLMDPTTAQLMPRVRIGDLGDRAFKPVSCSASGERSNPISEAFHCVTPIKQEKAFLHSDIVSHVSGKFGNNEKSGVLYLEISEDLLTKENHLPVVYFKAIRRCLDHCLNLF